jgi:hypothetical protein
MTLRNVREKVLTTYRGYELIVYNNMIIVVAPNGDSSRWESMARARQWVQRHRGERD